MREERDLFILSPALFLSNSATLLPGGVPALVLLPGVADLLLDRAALLLHHRLALLSLYGPTLILLDSLALLPVYGLALLLAPGRTLSLLHCNHNLI